MNPQLGRRARDAHRDLAAVGDEKPRREHDAGGVSAAAASGKPRGGRPHTGHGARRTTEARRVLCRRRLANAPSLRYAEGWAGLTAENPFHPRARG
jgi:hypothetical protein